MKFDCKRLENTVNVYGRLQNWLAGVSTRPLPVLGERLALKLGTKCRLKDVALIGNVQNLSAGLAMNCVRLVTLQPAGGAGEANLVRLQQGAQQAQEQGYTEDHDGDGDEPAACAMQRYVSEAGSGEGRYRKIEGIDIVADLRIRPMLGFVDDSGHDKQKHDQVHDCDSQLLVAPKPADIGPKA